MGRNDGPERWAAAMVSGAIDAVVTIHDDGSRPAMYDLLARYPGGRTAAIEVTAAADAVAMEQWNLMNGRRDRWTDPRLRGGWLVSTQRGARWNRLRTELPGLLADAEAAGVTRLEPQDWRNGDDLERRAAALGIDHAGQSGTDYPGSIYLTIASEPGTNVVWPSCCADPVAEWVGQFLEDEACRDVLAKLDAADADEKHAFVFVPGFTSAPFEVVDLLTWDQVELPSPSPRLPPSVSHVWICSGWTAGRGLRWCADLGWLWFDKMLDRTGTIRIS